MIIHSVDYESTSNGPGRRTVIHFQGCSIRCPGCFNRPMWSSDPVNTWNTCPRHLLDEIKLVCTQSGYYQDGVTISGGEPTDQEEDLIELLKLLRDDHVILFTGRTYKELKERKKLWKALASVEVVVSGPYVEEKTLRTGLLASTNQEYLVNGFEEVNTMADYQQSMELRVSVDGFMTVLGFPPRNLLNMKDY